MTREEFINKIVPTIENGKYRGDIHTRSSLLKEVKAAYKNDLTEEDIIKTSTITARLGINYTHMKKVAQKIAMKQLEGIEVSESQLPWGEWDPECPYLINHKGKTYLRLAVSGSDKHIPSVQYYYKGKLISKEDLQALGILRDSYWTKPKPDTVFNYLLDNVVSM